MGPTSFPPLVKHTALQHQKIIAPTAFVVAVWLDEGLFFFFKIVLFETVFFPSLFHLFNTCCRKKLMRQKSFPAPLFLPRTGNSIACGANKHLIPRVPRIHEAAHPLRHGVINDISLGGEQIKSFSGSVFVLIAKITKDLI